MTCQRRKLKATTFALVIANILLVITLCGVTPRLRKKTRSRNNVTELNCFYKEPQNDTMSTKTDFTRYCFRSSKRECLERGYVFEQQNNETNETFCCGNTNEHVYGILSTQISERLQRDTYRMMVLNNVKKYMRQVQHDPLAVIERPAIHAGILPDGNQTGPDSEVPMIQWEQSGERSFESGGVVLEGDRMKVTKTGFYYVYTGLQFSVGKETTDNGPLIAYLYKHEKGRKQKLMTSRESSCRQTRGDVTAPVSLYMAGIYLLRSGDEISVRTPGHSLLHRSSATTYMGMHMV